MMSRPTEISIILPTYNRANLLKRAVKSVLTQTYQNFELIIVDDGSTDDTFEAVDQFHDARIRYIRCDQNRGAAGARNQGIQKAKYSYIAFQDSDDVWKPEKLAKQIEMLKQAPDDTGIVYCEFYYHGINHTEGICPDREILLEQKQGHIFPELLTGNMIGMPTVLVKKECFLQAGVFHEGLVCLEDYEWILRIARQYRILFVPECLVDVYANLESVTNNVEGYMASRCIIAGLYKKELIQYGLFDYIVGDILNKATQLGYLEKATVYLEKVMSR